jgi:hypothetical protein
MILFFAIFSATAVLDFNHPAILHEVESVLTERGITLSAIIDGRYVSDITETDLVAINGYIIENHPDENPGWRKARFYLTVEIDKINPTQSELMIEAVFERYGVPNAYLSIPDEWIKVSSNGVLEKELLTAIKRRLSNKFGDGK